MKLIVTSRDQLELYITGMSLSMMAEFRETAVKQNSKIGRTKVISEGTRSHQVSVDISLSPSIQLRLRSYPTSVDQIKAHGFEVSKEDEDMATAQKVLERITSPTQWVT